jgi:hypothetical protein
MLLKLPIFLNTSLASSNFFYESRYIGDSTKKNEEIEARADRMVIAVKKIVQSLVKN